MPTQRRYRRWNYLVGWALAAAVVASAFMIPPPIRHWPWHGASYSGGVVEGYPRSGYEANPEWSLRPTGVSDSWLSLQGASEKYRCHAWLRVRNCPAIATGQILKRNDRVRIRYIEDTATGERFIVELSGRTLSFRCQPRAAVLSATLGVDRICERASNG
jgi:hypothetical protein